MSTITEQEIRSILDKKFNGVIMYGKHDKPGEYNNHCCALELVSVIKNMDWTDIPIKVRCFDFRAINDIHVPVGLRTKWMIKMILAYDNSLNWPIKKKEIVMEKIIILTTQKIISKLPGLKENVKEQCRNVITLQDVKDAAEAAAADSTIYAAAAAANAAIYAADSTIYAANAAYAAANAAIYVDVYSADNASAYAANAAYAAANAYIDKESIFVEACKLWLVAATLY